MSQDWDDLYLPYYTREPQLLPFDQATSWNDGYLQAAEADIRSPDPSLSSQATSAATSQDESSQQSSAPSLYWDAPECSPFLLPPSPESDNDTTDTAGGASVSSCYTQADKLTLSSTNDTANQLDRIGASRGFFAVTTLPSPAPSPPPEGFEVQLPTSDAVGRRIGRHQRDASTAESPGPEPKATQASGRPNSALFQPPSTFPNEIYFMILSELPPRDAYRCRLVSKSWYTDFWCGLVKRHWLPEIEIFARAPTSWIFEEFSAHANSGQRYLASKVQPLVDFMEERHMCTFHPSPCPSKAFGRLRLDRMMMHPVQLLVQFRGKRFWDFTLPLRLERSTLSLSFDLKVLLHVLLTPQEGEWPHPSEIPKWVWVPPQYASTTVGAFRRYR